MKAGPPHGGTRSPALGPLRLTGPVWSIGIAALTATALVAYWSRSHDLPIISLRLRPAPAARIAGAPLPPAQERLFGPLLRRIGLDDRTPYFEPEAYAMCVAQLEQHLSRAQGQVAVQVLEPKTVLMTIVRRQKSHSSGNGSAAWHPLVLLLQSRYAVAALVTGFEPRRRLCRYYADVGANRTDEALSEHYLTVGRPGNRRALALPTAHISFKQATVGGSV